MKPQTPSYSNVSLFHHLMFFLLIHSMWMVCYIGSSWMRRAKFETNAIQIFSDPKLEWMTKYAVDVGVWSLCVISIDENGIITSLYRNVHPKDIISVCSSNS
jgi:hypothetical protein